MPYIKPMLAEQEEKTEKYDKMTAQLELMCELNAGRKIGERNGWIFSSDVRSHFRKKANES